MTTCPETFDTPDGKVACVLPAKPAHDQHWSGEEGGDWRWPTGA